MIREYRDTEISKSFREKILELRKRHRLSFLINPGGGEFGHVKHGRCQVSMDSYEEDYRLLYQWLVVKGLEQES
jgi:hypothetical protein